MLVCEISVGAACSCQQGCLQGVITELRIFHVAILRRWFLRQASYTESLPERLMPLILIGPHTPPRRSSYGKSKQIIPLGLCVLFRLFNERECKITERVRRLSCPLSRHLSKEAWSGPYVVGFTSSRLLHGPRIKAGQNSSEAFQIHKS